MHIIVLGCGRIGADLALSLDGDGHSVAIIDRERAAFRRLPERFTGKAVLGNGFDRTTLEEASAHDAVALAAVMYGDNSNIIAARIARETYEIPNVVARIKDPRRAEIYQRLGIPTVATVTWTTDQVRRRLFPSNTVTEWTDAAGTLSLVERGLPDGWAGQRLEGLDGGEQFRIAAITRAGASRIPWPGAVGQDGDVLHIMVRKDGLEELEAALTNGGKHL